MDGSAISTIQQTAIEAAKANLLDTFMPVVVLRAQSGQQYLQSIEAFAEHRSRFRGTFETASIEDFKRYVVARPGGDGFIDPDKMSASVIFNLMDGEPGGLRPPGHGDHRAVLTLKPTAAFAALLDFTGPRMATPQKDFGLWIEDWADHLEADYAERPDTLKTASDRRGIKQALTAIRKLTIKASNETTHTDRDFGGSRSALDDVEASSANVLPLGFRFTCTPYEGLDEVGAYLRLVVLTDGDKPAFKLRWRQREANIEAIGQDFKQALSHDIGDTATMLLGAFTVGP